MAICVDDIDLKVDPITGKGPGWTCMCGCKVHWKITKTYADGSSEGTIAHLADDTIAGVDCEHT